MRAEEGREYRRRSRQASGEALVSARMSGSTA